MRVKKNRVLFLCCFISLLILQSSVLVSHEPEIPQLLSTEALSRLSPHSFNRYYHNINSQCGEDGIIEEIFRRLQVRDGFFVEFGAADGLWFSNSRYLWEKGWSGVMIEADTSRFQELVARYAGQERMLCLQEYITATNEDTRGATLDKVADKNFPDKEIDFLSIDVDGADYLILEGLQRKPKVICVEAGLHWHPLFNERIPDEFAVQNLQQPLAVMLDIARRKGYQPVCLTGNLILVRSDLCAAFQEVPSDVLTLFRDGWRSSFCRKWLVDYRQGHPYIMKFEGLGLQLRYPITEDF